MELGAIALLAALVGPLLTFVVSSQKMSGQIKHSEATELWAESRAIREYSSARIKELDEHIDALEARLTEVEKANTELAADNRKLMREIYELRSQIHILQEDKTVLKNLLAKEHEVVEHLKAAAHVPQRRYDDPPNSGEGGTE